MTHHALHTSPIIRRRCSLALAAVLLVACGEPFTTQDNVGSATGAAGAAAIGASLPACGSDPFDTHLNVALYSVPVPTELEAYATFPIDNASFCWADDELVLGYSLPKLLTGKSQHVSFQGGYNPDTGNFEMSGQNGTAVCTPTAPTWHCAETFIGLKVNLQKLHKLLEGLPPNEAQARLEVANTFIGDPIGTLAATVP